jgi:hypothetical protein
MMQLSWQIFMLVEVIEHKTGILPERFIKLVQISTILLTSRHLLAALTSLLFRLK